MKHNHKHLQQAINLAAKSVFSQRLSAIVYKGNKILGVGWNQINRHSKHSVDAYGSLHAEVAAIANAISNRKDVRGASLLVVRIRRDGSTALAYPCKNCMKVLYNVGIVRVYYTTETVISEIRL